MSSESRDRSAARDTAAYIGEDIGRKLTGRAALFVALLCLAAGAWTEADPSVRSAGLAAGGSCLFAIVVIALANPGRRIQWTVILLALILCGGLTIVMLLQHRLATGMAR